MPLADSTAALFAVSLQLATLMFSNNYGLDAVYYYLRCITSDNAFEGAESNLKRVIACRWKEGSRSSGHDAGRTVRACIDALRLLVHQLLFSASATPETLAASVAHFAAALTAAAKLPATLTVPSRPTCLDDAAWFKMALVILMTNMRLSRESKERLAVTAALLRHFFAALVSTLASRIACVCLQQQQDDTGSRVGGEGSESSNSDHRRSRESSADTSPHLRSRRRRRRQQERDASDSDLSDLEETALRAIDALDMAAQLSGGDEEASDDGPVSQSSHEEPDSEESLGLRTTRIVGLDSECGVGGGAGETWSVLQQLHQQAPMQTAKVLCDVLTCDPQTLAAVCCQQTSELQSLLHLLNLCVKVEGDVCSHAPWSLSSPKRPLDAEWRQRVPLPSDWTLLRFPLVAAVHADLLFSANARQLQPPDVSLICLQRIIAFGARTARAGGLIAWDAERQLFALPADGADSAPAPASAADQSGSESVRASAIAGASERRRAACRR